MNHRPSPSQPRPAPRGTRRTLTTLSGLAVFLTAAIGFAPAASAYPPPSGPSTNPLPPPPPAPPPAHFPLWAIVAMVAATVVLAVAATLITLAVEHLRRSRPAPAAAAEPEPGVPAPVVTPEPLTGQAEILSSHPHVAGHDMYRADSR